MCVSACLRGRNCPMTLKKKTVTHVTFLETIQNYLNMEGGRLGLSVNLVMVYEI